MPSYLWDLLLIVGGVGAGLVLTSIAVRALVRMSWGRVAEQFPDKPELPGAITRKMQSVEFFGWCGFNNCVRIVADERHLHVRPWTIIAWCGAKPMSIPWEELRELQPPSRFGYRRARVAGIKFSAPTWCMDLADAEKLGARPPG